MPRYLSLTMVLALTIILILSGCAGDVYSVDDFIDDLLDSGASVQIVEVSSKISHFTAHTKHIIKVNDEKVYVVEYNNEAQTDEEAARIFPGGDGMSRINEIGVETDILWSMVGQPHFFKKGRLIVEYVDARNGSDNDVYNLLVNILGPQFAGHPSTTTPPQL